MGRVVFILGAGASAQGGAPLMANFLDEGERLLRTEKVAENAEAYRLVFSAIGQLQAVHSKAQLDLYNIESVFNALVMARLLKKFPGNLNYSGETEEKALKQVIATTLEESLRFPVRERSICPPKPYGAFADLISYLRKTSSPSQSVAVLTFNYDMGVDLALYQKGLGPNYCLDNTESPGVPLLKLHGSLNWGECPKCNNVVPWHLSEYFKQFHYQFIEDGTDVRLNFASNFSAFTHCHHGVKPLPFLVPPTWNKTDHHEAISSVWQRAAKELSDAENIFVVGYSLPETDGFFKTLYALGVIGDQLIKRIWVYNPDTSGQVEQRFRNLIGHGAEGRFRYHAKRFDEAISHIKQEFPPRPQ